MNTEEHSDIECSIADRFRRQVASHPQRLAVASTNTALTYAELDRASNAAAQAIIGRVDARNERVLLRERLRDLLPAPAIPTGWSVRDRLPVDENSKVDRRTLGHAARAVTAIADPPATASLEARLTAICRDVLGLDSLDAHDNLFERGADSLALMRINGRLWTLGVGSFPCRRCSRIRPLPRYCERCNRSRETAEEFFG